MVFPYPDLSRRFSNTDNIIKGQKSHIVSELHSKYPRDYIDIGTHQVLEKTKPWAEIISPIRFQLSQQKSLQPIGIDKILILCVDFDDKPAQIPVETIYNRFFGDYSNSLKEYYKEVSYSRYIPKGEIYGWYRAPNPSTYYTDKQNGFGTYPKSAEKLVEDVVNIASTDPNIDWQSFDTNYNEYIDNLIIVHSGTEAAWTGNLDDFWAHVYITHQPLEIQYITVWVYAMVSEYLDIPENYQLVGIDSHEHGHQLGLPDLYDYTYKSNGVGFYSLMGSGSWGLKGMWPTHLDAWSKYFLRFTDTTENPVGTIYLSDAETNSNNIKYTTTDNKEYFLVENRQKIFYDKYLPSEGLLIWHINENKQDNTDNTCYLVGLIQADGFKDLENAANNGDLGDPYPGTSNNRSFGINTNPNSELCNKDVQNLLIKNISDSSTTMFFDSSFPTQVAQAGLNPAQALLLTGIATGAIYTATKHTDS